MKLSILDEHRSVRITHYNSSFSSHIREQFCICRDNKRFVDVEVEVQGIVFHCHKILLYSCCPYFAAHFSFNEKRENGVRNGSVERVVLKYAGISVTGFSRLLDYMYTSELEVTVHDVIDILHCADFLQFGNVVQLCSGFMQQHITEDTCLQIMILAESHGLHDLADKATNFILSHLNELIGREEFGQLSYQNLIHIISHPRLDVSWEAVVVQAMVSWVNAAVKQRKPQLEDLIKHARIRPIDIHHIRKISGADADGGCILKPNGDDEKSVWDLATKNIGLSSLPDRLTEVMVLVCRETARKKQGVTKDLSTVYFYDPESFRWERLTQLPFTNRQYYAVAVVNNILYLTGGLALEGQGLYCTRKVFSENWTYDLGKNIWREQKSMIISRYNHSCTELTGKLFVVGGRSASSGISLLGDGEIYNPLTDQWMMIAPIRCISGIGNAAIATLDGKVYLCGGTCNSLDCEVLPTFDSYNGAQVYDPEDDLWQELLFLEKEIIQHNIRVSSGDALAVDGFLLLLDDDRGKSLYLYNPVSKRADVLTQAHGHHRFAGWAVFQGQLVCTGGVDDGQFNTSDLVHAFDLTEKQRGWSMLAPLPVPMSHHACLIMYLNLPRPGCIEPETELPNAHAPV